MKVTIAICFAVVLTTLGCSSGGGGDTGGDSGSTGSGSNSGGSTSAGSSSGSTGADGWSLVGGGSSTINSGFFVVALTFAPEDGDWITAQTPEDGAGIVTFDSDGWTGEIPVGYQNDLSDAAVGGTASGSFAFTAAGNTATLTLHAESTGLNGTVSSVANSSVPEEYQLCVPTGSAETVTLTASCTFDGSISGPDGVLSFDFGGSNGGLCSASKIMTDGNETDSTSTLSGSIELTAIGGRACYTVSGDNIVELLASAGSVGVYSVDGSASAEVDATVTLTATPH